MLGAYPHKCNKQKTFISLTYYFEVHPLFGSYDEIVYKEG
jgi:hypothetical protein